MRLSFTKWVGWFTNFSMLAVAGLCVASCQCQRAIDPPPVVEQLAEPPDELMLVPMPPPPPVPKIESATLHLTIEFEQMTVEARPYYDSYLQHWISPPATVPAALTTSPMIGTIATFTRQDGGSAVRFVDTARNAPEMSYDEETGRYRLAIRYQPLESDGLLGAEFAVLGGFTELSLDYGPAFRAHRLRYVGVSRITLVLNAMTAFEIVDPSLTQRGEARFNLSEAFDLAATKFVGPAVTDDHGAKSTETPEDRFDD